MAEDKYMNAAEEKAFFERIKAGRKAAGKKKNFELYGIGDESQLEEYDRLIADGEKARNELPNFYGNLISSLASKYFKSGIPEDDLLQEGMHMLYEAAETYDAETGRFTTYLQRIVVDTFNTMIQNDSLLTQKRAMRDARKNYENTVNELAAKGIKNPTDEQVSKQSGLTLDMVKTIRGMGSYSSKGATVVSLDERIGDDNDGTLIDLISGEEDIVDGILTEIMKESLNKAMAERLTKEEEIVIRDRYGLNEEQTTISREDIAKKLGLTVTSVRMLERSAKIKLAMMSKLKDLL
jgi:RNA polymerase primary sigma factor